MGPGELLEHRLVQPGDDGIRDVAQRPAGFVDVAGVAQDVDPGLKPAVVGPAPGQVEDVLEVARLGERRVQLLAQPGPLRDGVEEPGGQDGIEQRRAAAQVLGQRRRPAHDLGQQVEQPRVGVEHREELDPGGQAGEELVELAQGEVGLRRLAQRPQQRRHELGQQLAAARRAGRPVPAVVPGAHEVEDLLALAEAERLEGRQGARLGLAAGEHQVAGGRERRRLLEQLGVVGLHRAERSEQRGAEGGRPVVAQESGDARESRLVVGQAMGLLIVDHLQPVLEPAQEAVGGAQFLRRSGVDVPGLGQRAQRLRRPGAAQARLAAAPDQLLGLRKELDLADAAAPQLDVVAMHGDPGAALVGVDLALDGVDVLDRPEIQVLAPDEGTQLGEKARAHGQVAGRGPRLDHGGALPVLAHALVVGQRRRDRDGERHGAGVGPEPEVGAEDVALGGALLQQAHQIAGQAHEAVLRPAAPPVAGPLGVEQDDEVDVGGVVELARAQLAHGDHRVAAVALRRLRRGQLQLAALGRAAEQVRKRRRERRVREIGQGLAHPLGAPVVGDVGDPGEQGDLAARAAQPAHETVALRLGGKFVLEPPQEFP